MKLGVLKIMNKGGLRNHQLSDFLLNLLLIFFSYSLLSFKVSLLVAIEMIFFPLNVFFVSLNFFVDFLLPSTSPYSPSFLHSPFGHL